MVYRDYEKAARKHLQTCKSMLLGLDCFESNNMRLSNRNREYLLMDIFYLSGYTLECTINYALFKLISNESHNRSHLLHIASSLNPPVQDIRNLPVKKIYDNPSTHRFAFYKRMRGVSVNFNYYVSGHDFWKNIDLLNNLLIGNSIPLISNKNSIPNNLRNMLDSSINGWKAEKRYETTQRFTLDDIRELVNFSEEVYNAIIREVGL